MNRDTSFNQITLITDGFSNKGIPPAEASRRAYNRGITVNVIGITNGNKFNQQAKEEITSIAEAGGGLYQIVEIEKIAQTVQLVTKKAVHRTIHQVVHTQLSQIIGNDDLTSIPPSDRLKVYQMMDDMAEYSNLNVLLLIDQSSSMQPKLNKVKEAILDFQLSLQARSGNSLISIATFPGPMDYIDVKIPWTKDIMNIDSLLHHLNPYGKTPTGPAIISSLEYFNGLMNKKIKNGVLDEYVI